MRGPIQLMKDAWTLFTGNARLFVGIYLVPTVLALVYGFFLALLMSPDAGGVLQIASIPFMIVLTIVLIVISIISAVALIKAVADPLNTTLSSAYHFGLQNIWKYLWLSILTGLAVLGGLILLIIPGIIFMVWFFFAYFVLVIEGKGGVEAMKASKAYVKGRWLPIFGRVLALALVLIVVSGVVSGIISAVTPFSTETVESLSGIINIVLVPFSIAYSYLMYQDVRKSPAAAQAAAPAPATGGGSPEVSAQ